jgi:hypothetical protein
MVFFNRRIQMLVLLGNYADGNQTVSTSSVIEFYKKIGYKDDDVVSLGKRLEPDE